MRVSLALCAALCSGAACLPESDDLRAYSAGWSPVHAGSGGKPAADAGSSVGAVAAGNSPAPESGTSVAGDGVVAGRMLPLAGDGGVDTSPADEAREGASGSPMPVDEPCADGVLAPDQTECYLVSTAAAAWQTARERCSAWDGALIKVETAAEDTFLASLLGVSAWLGASDTELENVFVWTDGTPVDFGNWGPAQPDRFPGPDCVEKRDTEGRFWFDQPCENQRAFVCEKAVGAAP
jgi:hypothetical protein